MIGKRIFVLLVLCLISVGFASCRTVHGTGGVIAGLDYKRFQELSPTSVKGESCQQHIFFFPVGEVTLNGAINDALSKAPEGTTGLSRVNVSYTYPIFGGLMFGKRCFVVEGFPAKRLD